MLRNLDFVGQGATESPRENDMTRCARKEEHGGPVMEGSRSAGPEEVR